VRDQSLTRISVVVGNPKPGSRTLSVANAVADAIEDGLDSSVDRLVVDLAEYAGELFELESKALGELTDAVAKSNVLVVASPTFKATYTGILKSFFDRYGSSPLSGVSAVPVMTGAAPGHYLAADLHLRPLLVELGASAPTRSLYVTEAQLTDLSQVVGAWAADAVPILERQLG